MPGPNGSQPSLTLIPWNGIALAVRIENFISTANPVSFEYYSPTDANHVLDERPAGRAGSSRLVQRFVQGVSVEKQY